MQLIADALPKDTLFNFSALTAFSEDDSEAACSIIRTFIEETGKNADRMQQALTDREVDGIAAMAHKLLPLFTLIGASESVTSLRWLESCRGEEFSEEVEKTTLEALEAVRKVVRAAEEYTLNLSRQLLWNSLYSAMFVPSCWHSCAKGMSQPCQQGGTSVPT